MVPGGRLIINIGYKYNAHKVLYFIVIDDAWRTNSGITYLPKHPGQYSNVAISPVYHPFVMYKFFGSFIEIDYHKKSRQSDLAL